MWSIKRVRDIEDTVRRFNIYLVGAPKGKKRTNGQTYYLKNAYELFKIDKIHHTKYSRRKAKAKHNKQKEKDTYLYQSDTHTHTHPKKDRGKILK